MARHELTMLVTFYSLSFNYYFFIFHVKITSTLDAHCSFVFVIIKTVCEQREILTYRS